MFFSIRAQINTSNGKSMPQYVAYCVSIEQIMRHKISTPFDVLKQ